MTSVLTRAERGSRHAVTVACTILLTGCGAPAPEPIQQPDAEAIRLIGRHDLDGRESLVVATRADPTNGSWAYVGHHESFWDGQPRRNSITGEMEWSGTSLVDVSDPTAPRLAWHIPNEQNANSRSVSVVYDYPFDGSDRDYLIRNSEFGDTLKFQIFDITPRSTDPSRIALVSEIEGTPPDSCGPGCGGRFIQRAHKGWWSQETGYFYSAAGEPGFRSTLIQIWDLRDPAHPTFVGRAWLPGQRDGEPGFEGQYAHHPNVDEDNDRVYVGYRGAGQTAAFDISNPAEPRLVWSLDLNPPHRGPHTVSPIVYEDVPNFGPSALPRTYAFVVDEAGEDDVTPCPAGVRSKSYMLDITDDTHPSLVSVWQVPVGDFCSKGGRFGPHQSAETVNGRLNRFEGKLAWIAYFNAGVRVVDLSDPYLPREVGYYVPQPGANAHPMEEGQPTVIQINDIDLDDRGLAYATDRAGSGLFVLEYIGPAPGGRPSDVAP